MKDKIQALAKRNREAKTKEEKEAIKVQMETLKKEDPKAYIEALESLIRSTDGELHELTIGEN